MRAVTGGARWLLFLAAMLGLAALNEAPATASGGGGLTGSCNPYVDGTLVPVPCSAGMVSRGNHGSGGAGSTSSGIRPIVSNTCTATMLHVSQAQSLGLSWPPPAGQSWALLLCFAGVLGAGPQVVLLNNATGAPAITPQQLLVTALGELRVPQLPPSTAPPRGREGLVGLPEWFWMHAAGAPGLSQSARAQSGLQ